LKALATFAQLGAPREQGIVTGNLAECLKAMGRERFVAACEKAGMAKAEAEQLADGLAKQ
jgi:hypothetical protein